MPAETKSTTTEEELAARVEAAQRALDEIRQRKAQALEEREKAEARLEEVGTLKGGLASAVYAGDQGATAAYERLENEEQRCKRAIKVARVAAEDFQAEVTEAQQRLEEANFAVSKEQARKRREALEELHARRDAAADTLEAMLEEEEKRFFPNRTRREISKWLRERYRDRLRVWLK